MAQKKITYIYQRVSSSSQDNASQLADLKRYVFGLSDDEKVVWVEDTFTGRKMNRPGWSQIEEKIRRGQVKEIVVARLDRLGRTSAGLHQLFELLQTKKVNLVSIREGVDLDTTTGRMVAGILASLAQWETEVRAERQAEGIRAARAAGKRWGGQEPGRRKLSVEKRRKMLRMAEEGVQKKVIAEYFGVSNMLVWRTLKELGFYERQVKKE